jgi:hypothetical protein
MKWVTIGLFSLAGVVATVGFIQAAGMNDAPTASECVDDWNGHAGTTSRVLIAEQGYRAATVRGWFHDYAGCGIVFLPVGAHPLPSHTCTRGFSSSDPAGTDWACEQDTVDPGTSGSRDAGEVAVVSEGWRLSL